MADSKELINQVAREIEASPTTSPTAAGRTSQAGDRTPPSDEQIDTINQVFALFRLNYHNQFYAAYPDNEQLNQVKKLWLDALADYPMQQVLLGAKHAIETSEYLPTLNRMLESCQEGLKELGLPSARAAYLEACQAGSPKSAQAWTHPAVYLAGHDADWYYLANQPESKSWPVYRDAYRHWCGKVLAGEILEVPAPQALPASSGEPSSKEEALAEIAKIKDSLSK
ncbi:MAG: replication protein P [Halieaceae bacterium]